MKIIVACLFLQDRQKVLALYISVKGPSFETVNLNFLLKKKYRIAPMIPFKFRNCEYVPLVESQIQILYIYG